LTLSRLECAKFENEIKVIITMGIIVFIYIITYLKRESRQATSPSFRDSEDTIEVKSLI